MGTLSIAVHINPRVGWQNLRAACFIRGLRAIGIEAKATDSRERVADIAILYGTTFWRRVECDGGRYLLVDRASIGDPDYVSLVWDGHGRRGNHCVPQTPSMDRWDALDAAIQPWKIGAGAVVLCGQTESYSPHFASPNDWYARVVGYATHFRPHPAGQNPTSLPDKLDWDDVGRVITLNSSVGVESVLRGIPTVTMDEAAMAWPVTGHEPGWTSVGNRTRWCRWLAWTQWRWDEIEAGEPIRHLFGEFI